MLKCHKSTKSFTLIGLNHENYLFVKKMLIKLWSTMIHPVTKKNRKDFGLKHTKTKY